MCNVYKTYSDVISKTTCAAITYLLGIAVVIHQCYSKPRSSQCITPVVTAENVRVGL